MFFNFNASCKVISRAHRFNPAYLPIFISPEDHDLFQTAISMNRRNFFYFLSGTSVAFLPLIQTSCGPSDREVLLSRPDELLRLCDEDGITSAGIDYLSAYPRERDRKVLTGLLTSGSSVKDFHTAQLQSQIDREYRDGLTVVADGWILSRTEARQCALFTILKSNFLHDMKTCEFFK